MTTSPEPPPKPPRPPYWSPLIIDGQPIDRSHLEPFRHTFWVERLDRNLTFNVIFSCHCFSDHFEEGVHDEARKIMDGKNKRVFCATRLAMSQRLPNMLRDLPNQAVWRAWHGRNYVYAASLDDGLGGHYPLFFTITKETTTWSQLSIVVESAYAVTDAVMYQKLEGARSIPFAILCAETFLGQKVKTKAKR